MPPLKAALRSPNKQLCHTHIKSACTSMREQWARGIYKEKNTPAIKAAAFTLLGSTSRNKGMAC
ncbi:hypothetical protein AA0312_0187 [Acetobacter tropicalis NRIC 0312]|uniref:Uncharacterized protein n=1 Tax=Acetobacter tropicalis TaxID=104102 RepID=A0A511FII1_9PROT|nr:hypothetical protein ATR1_075d0105 [Acetobacter tropicalis]GBR66936.1 hypothetical protein AA0312_0187 [Acetobacter tropicalis NRIC 0312]GEL49030.1 hypothetical protein ATR01nite_01050 [Acetobacter tropicalis]